MTPAVVHAAVCRDCPLRAGCRVMHSGQWCERWPEPPPGWTPAAPINPALTIAQIEAGTLPPGSVSREVVAARLAACRACPLWDETARQGRGGCASVRCNCSIRALWRLGERCPEGRWSTLAA